MKKIFIIIGVVICCVFLCACSDSKSIGIIGGADGPTAILVGKSGNNTQGYEIDSVRMVKINGELYYDTDKDSETDVRCGNMDGNFKKGVSEFEIPQNDGESNFSEGNAWQSGASEGAVEIPIGDDWEIFKKLDANTDISKYKYCYILEGRMPNAKEDSELLVLSEDMNTTFEEATYKLVGSDLKKKKDIYVLPIVD